MGIYSNADPYLNVHSPTDTTVEVTTIKGQKGVSGEKGAQGQHGRVTRVILSISNIPPTQLDGPGIPANWDFPSVPNTLLSANPGDSVVYTVDNSIWTYMPGCNARGWAQTGYVNAEIYTVPGDKGEKGGFGPKGDKGEVGPQGLQGSKGSKGSTGQTGDTGEKGQKGTPGLLGSRGLAGARGRAGVDGVKGDKGIDGINGNKGEKGSTGVGVSGEKGQTGSPGKDGVTPGLEAVPIMIASYDGNTRMTTSSYNVYSILYMDKGTYRFRLREKTAEGKDSTVICSVQPTLENNEAFLVADVVEQTDRIITVRVRDFSTGETNDAKVSVVVYNP